MGGMLPDRKQMPAGMLSPPFTGEQVPGQVALGNIDLRNRPVVRNPDGSISTVSSMSVGMDGREVLLPTISPSGARLSPEGAEALYRATGMHLGQFDTPENATAYAERLHSDQERFYRNKR